MERGKLKLLRINGISVLLIFVFFIGIALRAQELISHNFLFLLDQGRDMMAVKSILYDHHLTLIGPATSLRGVFQGPLWYYLLAFPTAIFGGNPWGGIVLMFTLSVVVLLVVYFWMKTLFGQKTALITIFLFAVSPEAIASATFAWNPHPMWLLIVLYIFSFFSTIYKSKKFNIILWPIIGLMFHFQTALGFFILLASIIYVLVFQRKIILNKYFIIGLSLFFFTFIPQIVFDLRHDFLMSKSVVSLFKGSDQGLFAGGEKVKYMKVISEHIFSFYNNFKSAFINAGIAKYISDFFILLIFLSVFLVAKKSNIFVKQESSFLLFISRLLLIIFLLSFAYPFPLRSWFLTGFQSFYLALIGVILGKLLKFRIVKVATIFIFLIIIFYSVKKIETLYINLPNDGGAEKIKGKLSAIDYIYNDSKDRNFNLLVFTPAVNTDAYDYLIWWHGGKKYNYIPDKEKKSVFYLLIEKDYSKPWSYKGWLETVIKVGAVEKTKELPSGIIIQKRYLTTGETKE